MSDQACRGQQRLIPGRNKREEVMGVGEGLKQSVSEQVNQEKRRKGSFQNPDL